MANSIITLWLAVLTVLEAHNIAATFASRSRWKAFERRENALDNAERIQRVLDLMTAKMMQNDAEIRRQVDVLITALEADPMAHEKHWSAIHALRAILKNA
jgi:hypothetical protein